MTPNTDLSILPRSTGAGAQRNSRNGLGMPVFEYRQAEEIRDTFRRHGVRYLFIGMSGAILLGFPDTTQDADIFVEKDPKNCQALVRALQKIGFALTAEQAAEIVRGKDFVQLKNGNRFPGSKLSGSTGWSRTANAIDQSRVFGGARAYRLRLSLFTDQGPCGGGAGDCPGPPGPGRRQALPAAQRNCDPLSRSWRRRFSLIQSR